MPRAFLVKKVNIVTGKRSWSEIPDSSRGESGDIPESLFPPYVHEVSEGNIAEYSCFTTAQNKFLTAKLPSSAAQGQLNHKPECRIRTQRVPYLRSKIKDMISLFSHFQITTAFTQRCSLESHLKKIHAITQQYAYKERRDKLYVCEECGLTAQTRDSLQNHLQADHPQRLILRKSNCMLAHIEEDNVSLCSPETPQI
ncbi:putative transcription factor Ovo-like [Pimephales promelas]|nr:putative transcription factor Ovo-like [Pimephales promelas]